MSMFTNDTKSMIILVTLLIVVSVIIVFYYRIQHILFDDDGTEFLTLKSSKIHNIDVKHMSREMDGFGANSETIAILIHALYAISEFRSSMIGDLDTKNFENNISDEEKHYKLSLENLIKDLLSINIAFKDYYESYNFCKALSEILCYSGFDLESKVEMDKALDFVLANRKQIFEEFNVTKQNRSDELNIALSTQNYQLYYKKDVNLSPIEIALCCIAKTQIKSN